MLLTLLVAVLVVALDQTSKVLVVQHLKPIVDKPLIDGVLHLHYAENTGAAFSIFQDARWFFTVVSAVACVAILAYLIVKRPKMHWVGFLSLGLIIGGAIGNNLIDRIRLGYIVDFIYVKAINFAIFNVADMGVSVGAVLLCIYVAFFHEGYMKRLKAEQKQSEEVSVGPAED